MLLFEPVEKLPYIKSFTNKNATENPWH